MDACARARTALNRNVRRAQRLGFSLHEIAELLRLEDGTHCEEASSLAEHKLNDVREKQADLARIEAALSDLVCACHATKGNVSCPLIAALQGGESTSRCQRGVIDGRLGLTYLKFLILRRPQTRDDR